MTVEWRRLRNLELYEVYFSRNIIPVIKSRRMRWAGHVAHMGERRGVYRFWWGNLSERDHLEDPGEDARIIFRSILRSAMCGHGLDEAGSG